MRIYIPFGYIRTICPCTNVSSRRHANVGLLASAVLVDRVDSNLESTWTPGALESTVGQPIYVAFCRQGIYVKYSLEYSKCCALNGILVSVDSSLVMHIAHTAHTHTHKVLLLSMHLSASFEIVPPRCNHEAGARTRSSSLD